MVTARHAQVTENNKNKLRGNAIMQIKPSIASTNNPMASKTFFTRPSFQAFQ